MKQNILHKLCNVQLSLLVAWCKNVDFTSARLLFYLYFVVGHFVKRFIITSTQASLLNS